MGWTLGRTLDTGHVIREPYRSVLLFTVLIAIRLSDRLVYSSSVLKPHQSHHSVHNEASATDCAGRIVP